jgi:hypothetical protein
MLSTYGIMSPVLESGLRGLTDIPVDIAPEFPLAMTESAP